MAKEVYYITAKDLAERDRKDVPAELQSAKHLIYSSPATLAFNSPGAQGFGVKRAGLAIPGSVMLLVAPACCGRNTQLLNELGYAERFFYMLQDDTDIVTGRHLNKISKAVCEVVEACEEKPTAVMICITCVDALLGTDMERVCRKATKASGVPVLPCYMYALTREGRVPPMTSVRKTVYELLEKRERKGSVVNLLGEFAPYADDSEIYSILQNLGIKKINEISRCKDFEEYLSMAEANFNLILNPESRLAADDLKKRLGIPALEIRRQYQIDKIKRQYELLGGALGKKIDDTLWYSEALAAVTTTQKSHPDLTFAVGEWVNADAFELSLALLRYGFKVSEIYGTVSNDNFVYIKKIAMLSPETKIFSNLNPTMLNYNCSESTADITIGRDAGYYHPDAVNIPWNEENKPFGYVGLKNLFVEIQKVADALAGDVARDVAVEALAGDVAGEALAGKAAVENGVAAEESMVGKGEI